MKTLIYLLLATCLLLNPLAAQSPVLEAYVEEGLSTNLMLQAREIEVQRSLVALEEARALFMPNISFQASYTLAGGGRTINLPLGDLFNPVYQTLNGLTNSNAFPQLENVAEQFLPNNFHETKIRVVQPIFNSDIYFNYKAKEALISVEEARKKAYKQQLSRDIRVAYYQYLQAQKVIEVYQNTDTLLQEVLRSNEKLVKYQKATPEIVYAAEYERAKLKTELSEAEKNLKTGQAYFNFLLNRPFESEIISDSSLTLQALTSPSLASLESDAMSKREELKSLEAAQAANRLDLQRREYSHYPSLNAVADVGYQGFGYTFDQNQDFWLVQLSLRWDLFKGKQVKRQIEQGQIAQKKLALEQSQVEQQIKLEIRQKLYALSAAQQAVEAAQVGIRSAEKSFYLNRRKYQEGQGRYLELIDAQNNYKNAQLRLILSQFDYLIRLADLQQASGNLAAE